MQIAIISDIHNNEINLDKVLRHCAENKISTLICCGDLASREILELMNDNFSGEIYYTFGNADYSELRELENREKYRNTYIFKNVGEAIFDGKRIAFTHYPATAKKLSKTLKYAFVFYGHTHKPWVASVETMVARRQRLSRRSADQRKKCTMLNPGNVAGEIYPPTFAIWNTENDNFKLLRIHDLK